VYTETTIWGETFTYKTLWDCCLAQMEAVEKAETGKQAFYITAMLMAYLTYESYINFLGDRFAPVIWANEREFFRQEPYRGVPGKLRYLERTIPIKGIKRGLGALQTISQLKKIRDVLSHGKVDKYEKKIRHKQGEEPPLFGSYGMIDKLVTPEFAAKAVHDVNEFITFLHSQARKHTKDIWFGKTPWDDFRGHAMSDSSTKV
jgi:hypothetical protein